MNDQKCISESFLKLFVYLTMANVGLASNLAESEGYLTNFWQKV